MLGVMAEWKASHLFLRGCNTDVLAGGYIMGACLMEAFSCSKIFNSVNF